MAADLPGQKMTRSEREDLLKVARLRMKVAKSDADKRAAEVMAAFEKHLATIYSFDQNEVWAKANAIAKQAAAVANKLIAEECAKLGIPKQFAPSINTYWSGRNENESRERRAELRKVAVTAIDSMKRDAYAAIERQGAEIQTGLLAIGLREQAAALLNALPKPNDLMPLLQIDEATQKLLPSGPAGKG
jgi:hypothetical protein